MSFQPAFANFAGDLDIHIGIFRARHFAHDQRVDLWVLIEEIAHHAHAHAVRIAIAVSFAANCAKLQ